MAPEQSAVFGRPEGVTGSFDPRSRDSAATGDDIAAFGLHVSPDPDLVTYWLAGVIDEQRGYGIAGESSNAFDQLVKLGAADWFRLGE